MEKLLYYAPVSYGGLLIYAQEQADALAGLGIAVDVLCPPDFPKRSGDRYEKLSYLDVAVSHGSANPILKSFQFYRRITGNLRILNRVIRDGGYRNVFFVSYAEYFAPLWAGSFCRLRDQGVRFGAMVQEPVRNFQVGPRWWHEWSVGCAYSFLSNAFVHEDMPLETHRSMPSLKVGVVPMAPHKYPDATQSREEVRRRLGIPRDALVLFSFGHIRDNKNLEYSIMALREIPKAYLIVAGSRKAASQRPESFYKELAESLGVDDRCRWFFDYVTEEEAANFFNSSDLVVLTYGRNFHSASGVLNVAARYRKPCIASAGEGSLKTVVYKYRLGVWVEADDPQAVVDGLRQWMERAPIPDWDGYGRDNSWHRNASIVSKMMEIKTFPYES
jgi:glycosyltransferase involved in cell wall biosynthesis